MTWDDDKAWITAHIGCTKITQNDGNEIQLKNNDERWLQID